MNRKLLLLATLVPLAVQADQSIVAYTGQTHGLMDRNQFGRLRTDLVIGTNSGMDASFEIFKGLRLGAGYFTYSDSTTLYVNGRPIRDTTGMLIPTAFVEYQHGSWIARLSHSNYDLDFYAGYRDPVTKILYSNFASKHYSTTMLWIGYEYKY